MRIIDERKCQCHTCGNTLAYTEEDIHNNAGDSFIICPCCETRIFLVDGVPCSAMISCDNCNKSFELPSEYCDTYIGANGCEYTTCPHCGNEQWIGEGIELDKNNIIYPQHFYHYSGTRTVPISDDRTTDWIRECISKLDKETDSYLISSGDTLCFAVKSDESTHEATVYVCKEYSECNITIPEEKF